MKTNRPSKLTPRVAVEKVFNWFRENPSIAAAVAVGGLSCAAMAQAVVPAEVQDAIDIVEVSFQAIAALAVTIGVFWIAFRMLRRV